MTLDVILFTVVAILFAIGWRHNAARQRRADAQTLTAYTQGYAAAHDDIYRALMGAPDEAHQRLIREARRQRVVARDQ